ncbi:MAG: putative signal transducing protein, partial [Caldilinea sp.]
MSTLIERLPGLLRRRTEGGAAGDPATGAATTGAATTGAATTTGGGSENEPVVVWEAANLMEAYVVKGRLESEGIPALIRGEAVGAIYGLTAGSLAVVKVLVPAPLVDQALTLLLDAEDETGDGETGDGETGDGETG